MSSVTVRALTAEEWDPENWKGDMWEDLDKDGDIEPLNSDESSLPVEAASPPPGEAVSASPSERVNSALPLRKLQCPPIALQDNTDYSQYPSFFFASRPITRLKSQKPPK